MNVQFDCTHTIKKNQEMMLKKGMAWHNAAYDQRPELAKVKKLFADPDQPLLVWLNFC